jgi:hypothetical protein
LGRPGYSARHRNTRRLTFVAVPALAGVAAAIALANSPAVAMAAGPATTHHPAATAAPAALLADTAPQAVRAAHAAPAAHAAGPAHTATYAVRDGDTLSSIARHLYHDPDFWPVLYWANHKHIQYANQISAGQVLTVPAKPAKAPGAPSVLGPAPAPAPASAHASAPVTGYGPASPAPVQHYAPVQSASSYAGSGSFQSCVIARESGGSSQVMNSSGHYGLYQFSASTWAAYGGNPGDFGNASVSEQNQVFGNAIAAGGQSNWSAYDGC